ncbi:hypothetical protein PUN4_80039 [Paraburkholderia unamae]|nr:hypothetical protein PUN4_80039 [Paraburkholderia unamae]
MSRYARGERLVPPGFAQEIINFPAGNLFSHAMQIQRKNQARRSTLKCYDRKHRVRYEHSRVPEWKPHP